MKSVFLKLFLCAVGTALTANAYSADVPAAPGAKASGEIPAAGLQLWLSAGQVEQTGGSITVIKDLSGKENHARRDPATAKPTTNPAIVKDSASGQPILRFSGDNVAFAFKQIPDIRAAFWVVSKDPAAFGKRNEKFVLGDKDSNDFHAGWTDDVIFNTVVKPDHLSKFLADGKTWLNGQSIVASKTPFPKQLALISIISTGPVKAGQLARDRNMSSRSWQGEIAEIVIYNVELSDVDRQAVEKYLLSKYAIKPAASR